MIFMYNETHLEEFSEPHMTKVTCFSAALRSKTKYRRIRL